MMVAPSPIRKAQPNPRRAPSLTIEMLIGPTGIETRNPLANPQKAGTRYEKKSGMQAQPGKLSTSPPATGGRQTVEAGEAKCAANQINRRDEPADFGTGQKDVV